MCKKIDNSVIGDDDGDAGPLGPARGKIGSPRLRRTSVRVRASILAWFSCSSPDEFGLIADLHCATTVILLLCLPSFAACCGDTWLGRRSS